MKHPKLIILDWDNTLIKTKTAFLTTINHIMEKYRLPEWNITRETKGDSTKSLKENFPIIFEAEAEKAYQDYLDYYATEGYKFIEQMDGAELFLKKLESLGINFCIITNKDRQLLINEINKCYPKFRFTHVLANGDTPNNKPAPDAVFKVMEDFDFELNSENVWLIGDSEGDLQCATTAGCKAVLFGCDNKGLCKKYNNVKNYANFNLLCEIFN